MSTQWIQNQFNLGRPIPRAPGGHASGQSPVKRDSLRPGEEGGDQRGKERQSAGGRYKCNL